MYIIQEHQNHLLKLIVKNDETSLNFFLALNNFKIPFSKILWWYAENFNERINIKCTCVKFLIGIRLYVKIRMNPTINIDQTRYVVMPIKIKSILKVFSNSPTLAKWEKVAAAVPKKFSAITIQNFMELTFNNIHFYDGPNL